ncbi:MAG: manganese efflux pump [Eubacteriales bacterium]|nr:manganese efflux pump [Eubacteriales bacterium]
MDFWMLIVLLTLVMLVYLDPTMSVGATQKCLTMKNLMKYSLLFSVALLIITGVGMVIGAAIKYLTGLYGVSYLLPIFAFLLMVVLGSYMVMRTTRKEDFQERLLSPITVWDYIRIAFAWCVPIFLTGMCVGITVKMSILSFLITFALSFLISLGGLMYGNRLGYRYMKPGSALAGVMLFVLAIFYIAPYATQLQIPQM